MPPLHEMEPDRLSPITGPYRTNSAPKTERGTTHTDTDMDTMQTSTRKWNLAFMAICTGLLAFMVLSVFFIKPLWGGQTDHYIYLARSFTHGVLSVDTLPDNYPDVITWDGHKYLPFGPLPALLLIPFLPLFDLGLDLRWPSFLFTLLNLWLFAGVLRRVKVVGERQKWSLLLFFGGTVYFFVTMAGTSWAFAHVITTTFLLLTIYETLGRRRPVLIGLALGLAGMTRFSSLFALAFPLWLIWRDDRRPALLPKALSASLLMLVGLAGPVLVLFIYNFMRFSSPLENGYAQASIQNPVIAAALAQGLFSLVHIPKNLFMFLLQGPVAYPSDNAPVLQFPYVSFSPWGLGVFFTSPALLYMLRSRLREPLTQACWLAAFVVAVPVMTYYGVGWIQFGYRYALDFLPFLVLLAALGLPEPLTVRARLLVVISVLVNLWGWLLLLTLVRG